MFKSIRNWVRRLRYREGRTLSGFIACDIRRDILIVSSARVDEGMIIGRVRTTNVLYLSGGLIPEPEFEPRENSVSMRCGTGPGKVGAACRTGRQSLIGSPPRPQTPNKGPQQTTAAILVARDEDKGPHFGGVESRLGFRMDRMLGCLTFVMSILGNFVFRLRAVKELIRPSLLGKYRCSVDPRWECRLPGRMKERTAFWYCTMGSPEPLRIAKLAPGTLIRVEVIGTLPKAFAAEPKIGGLLP